MSHEVAPEPLARLANRTPIVYGALGAVLHLEPLAAEDEARLDAVNDMVWDWIGPALTHVSLSCAERPEAVRRAHLDYISTHGANLGVPPVPGGGPEDQRISAHLVRLGRDEMSVVCSGSRDPFEASPYSYRFWAEIGDLPEGSDALHLTAHAVLHLTVPETWPLADFHARICAIAAKLRLRWGAAGYTFSDCEAQNYQAPAAAIYAHARRYWGYDVAEYVRLTEAFHRRIRTVSWLTWLGPSMLDELRAGGGLGAPRLSTWTASGDGVLIQAGGAPERGDVNRRQVPPAYREVDALVRPLRAAGGADLQFFAPWDERSIERWLRRFEVLGGP
ncbi:type VI immunity family protein [Sorangium sp. So ce590]|uniref:type VI immunity family protein n=1 Tax=unclassified Sorangium TaxID=2621164 RepID=UPI003F62A78D